MADSVSAFFESVTGRLAPERTVGLTHVYQFHITGDGGGDWALELRDGQPAVTPGTHPRPDVIVTASAADWLEVVRGALNPQTAFLTGRLQVAGDVTLAVTLQGLLQRGS